MNNWTKSILSMVCLLYLAGCSVAPKIQSHLNHDVQKLFQEGLNSLALINGKQPNTNFIEMSLQETLERAISMDPEIRHLTSIYQKIKIDVAQAQSLKWPRIELNFSAEKPIGGDTKSNDTIFSYGLSLDYNVLDTIFLKDGVQVNLTRLHQVLLKKDQAQKNIFYDLLLLLAEIEYYTQRSDALVESMVFANRIISRFSVLKTDVVNNEKELDQMRGIVRNIKRKQNETRLSIKRLDAKLHHMVGIDYGLTIVITDKNNYFFSPETFDINAQITKDLIVKAWNQRNDIEIEKKNLFLAEMGIVMAKRGRLPRVKTSLGVGNFYLDSVNSNVDLVPRIGISIPVFDMGDIKRRVQKMETDRDDVKSHILSLSQKMVYNLWDSHMKLSSSIETLEESKKDIIIEHDRMDRTKRLVDIKRRPVVELYKTQMEQIKREMEYFTAVFNFRKALIEFQQIKGDPLPGDLHVGLSKDTQVLSSGTAP